MISIFKNYMTSKWDIFIIIKSNINIFLRSTSEMSCFIKFMIIWNICFWNNSLCSPQVTGKPGSRWRNRVNCPWLSNTLRNVRFSHRSHMAFPFPSFRQGKRQPKTTWAIHKRRLYKASPQDQAREMSFTAARIMSVSTFCFWFWAPIVSALVRMRLSWRREELQLA